MADLFSSVAPPDPDDWVEVEWRDRRLRYRPDPHAGPGYACQYYDGKARLWRDVRNVNSLEWFAIGMRAAEER